MDLNAVLAKAESDVAQAKASAARAWRYVAVHWFFFVPGAGMLGYLVRAITHG